MEQYEDKTLNTSLEEPLQEHGTANQKVSRKAKKKEKKAKKKQRRIERRAAFRALSTGKKFLHCLIRVLIVCAILFIIGFFGIKLFTSAVTSYYQNKVDNCYAAQASQEEILLVAPLDTEGDARLEAMAPYSAGDTWAIYMYVCGSDLESNGYSALTDTTQLLTMQEQNNYSETESANKRRRFYSYVDEMQQQGMQLPNYFFLPVSSVEESTESSSDDAEQEGFATKNIRDALTVDLPDNVSVVIQTGGAKRWSLPQVNPNTTQRFLYNTNGLTQLSSSYPQNMGSQQTLEEFLSFCQGNYPADHQMLLFWNHGGGCFGFCYDEIYGGDGLTLPELKGALTSVYSENPSSPAFELVGFDACLMATTEVTDALYGYTRYLAASEEIEAGDGWAYSKWLGALAQHPEMNGAQLGKAIADSFVESCANVTVNLRWAQVDNISTFSVIDVEKAKIVSDAYASLASAALQDAAENPSPIAALSRAASKSIRYAGTYYKYFNSIDLGTFMDNLQSDYPEETGLVLEALDDAVLYHRETSYAQGSKGLAVYFPTDVDSLGGLIYYLEYLDAICSSPDVKALYYYKIAGCLNDELQTYASQMGYGQFKNLDAAPLGQLSITAPTINEDSTVELPISNEAASLTQDMSVAVARYFPDSDELRFLGDDACLYMDEYRTIRTTFDGSWLSIDGHPLMLEIIDQTNDYIRYRSPITYNDLENSYLVLALEFDTNEVSLLGVQTLNQQADTMCRNLENVEEGAKITPCYRMENMGDETISTAYGDTFTYKYRSKIENTMLEDGEYYLILTITDIRGDEYYPLPITFTISDQTISRMEVPEDLVVYPSAE